MKDDKFIEEWKAIKKQGRLKFALREGIVFGVVLFLITSLLKLRKHSFSEIFLNEIAFMEFLFWIIGGFIGYFTVMWWTRNFIYKIKMKNHLPKEKKES